ncbi:MAG: chromosome segregation protein SMC [Eubacteriales bacterium]|nr:chromosome segregation protein SMC [Eubacteriales bacterium]
MYLKSIEIHGFKSFANKIKFEFHNGITAIVGPNGSGKSNVADAVRWVLGEQRIKQLRGASMQDVIFAGTELRKPLGYAYVAITLDNSDHQLAIDYSEVTVARRLYRSGESEYLLNGTPCRLKDVNELFYDTGIGKEGYSIIGQGQIEKILSDKPEDRRELFDEAAGIVKFKRRKEASEKKLESERANLVRVNDILSELDKQVGPLERQSEKARIYLKTRESLKALDVNVFLMENGRTRTQLEEMRRNQDIAAKDLEETKTQYEGARTEYERIQSEIETLEKEMEEARGKITDTSVVRGKLEGDIKVYREQIRAAQSNAAHFASRQEAVREQLARYQKEKESILTGKSGIDDKMNDLLARRGAAREEMGVVSAQIEAYTARIEEGKNAILDALGERASIKSRIASLSTMAEQIDIRKSELTSRLVLARTQESEQEERIAGLQKQFEEVCASIIGLKEEQTGIEAELDGMKKSLAEKDQQLRDAQIRYHQDKTKLESLANLTERYEGFGGSVKKVMENKAREKGLIGVVADLLKTSPKYETAMEVALGGNIQNIVTDDEATAKRMISLLKRERAGRATFLPLTSIEHPQEFNRPEVLKAPGVVGLADELVETKPEYRNVAKAMLGRIVIVDTFDHAVQIANRFGHSVRMVTIEGELFVPGGAISGGAFRNSSNLLGRRREMSELEGKVRKSLEQIDALNEEIAQTRERRSGLRAQLETSKNRLQEQFIAQNTARMNVIKEQERKKEAAGSYVQLKEESEGIEAQTASVAQQKEEMRAKLAASEQLEKETTAQIETWQSELNALQEEESAKGEAAAKWDLEIERIRQQQQFAQQNLDRIAQDEERASGELREIVESIEGGEEEVRRRQQDIEEIEKTIAASHTVQSDAEKTLKESTEKKETLNAKQKEFFTTREQLSEKLSSLDKEVYRLNAQREKLEESIESQINYMWDEYEITLSDAAAMRDETMTDLPAMKKEIAGLKNRIRSLGDVNMGAIEEYKTLMERYTFLKGQHDDLVEAEKTLQGIIEDLDEAMRRQFKAQFARITAEFDKVFKELFGGGKGTLELMEDADLLEAGVRVIAQPPGKKLQNMMQLSGGEKSLTAIALLFAIQSLKPSPFCLLDEIEAALDESNVGRFAGYLHKLTRSTQFIVITHRRGTMERADRLYGITMQEKGISALVSVNLIDKELSA